MIYFEIIEKHEYINEIINSDFECDTVINACHILNKQGYSIVGIEDFDDDFKRIYVTK